MINEFATKTALDKHQREFNGGDLNLYGHPSFRGVFLDFCGMAGNPHCFDKLVRIPYLTPLGISPIQPRQRSALFMPAQKKSLSATCQRECGYQPEGGNEPPHSSVRHLHLTGPHYPQLSTLDPPLSTLDYQLSTSLIES